MWRKKGRRLEQIGSCHSGSSARQEKGRLGQPKRFGCRSRANEMHGNTNWTLPRDCIVYSKTADFPEVCLDTAFKFGVYTSYFLSPVRQVITRSLGRKSYTEANQQHGMFEISCFHLAKESEL